MLLMVDRCDDADDINAIAIPIILARLTVESNARGFFALTRPVRRKVGLNAKNLRRLFSRAAPLSGKHL
jgi:hypothetical protein